MPNQEVSSPAGGSATALGMAFMLNYKLRVCLHLMNEEVLKRLHAPKLGPCACSQVRRLARKLSSENVGGPVFDAVLPLLNNFARIPVCGLIAHYNAAELPPGPDHLPLLMRAILARRLTFRGFICFDYASQFPRGMRSRRSIIA
jgi:hypothetical protein